MSICSGRYDAFSLRAEFILMCTFILVLDPDCAGQKIPSVLLGKGAVMGSGQN